MKSIEQQKMYLHIAKAYVGYEVTQTIRKSNASQADKELMICMINATYTSDSWDMFCKTDTTLQVLLLDIIEETYYGGITENEEPKVQ